MGHSFHKNQLSWMKKTMVSLKILNKMVKFDSYLNIHLLSWRNVYQCMRCTSHCCHTGSNWNRSRYKLKDELILLLLLLIFIIAVILVVVMITLTIVYSQVNISSFSNTNIWSVLPQRNEYYCTNMHILKCWEYKNEKFTLPACHKFYKLL